MKNEYAIEIDSLKKVYRNGWFSKQVQALRGVSFKVRRGEVFGLLGPNGAGKTTAIKIFLGIVRKTGGSVSLFGHSAGDLNGRRRVGYLPENLTFPRHHTAYTALEYYGSLSGLTIRQIRAKRDDLLELVGLKDWSTTAVKKFSKGMRQRLGLAQSLLHDPDLLILDEPTDGLDPVGRAQVREMLAQLKERGKTIFINSHLLQEVEMVCDHVAILDWGKLKYVGTIDKITNRQQRGDKVEFEFELIGDEEPIREVFKDLNVQHFEALTVNSFQVRAGFAEQAAVDRCIDRLRKQKISIIGLTQHRITLEDAFLKLLGKGPTTP